MLADEWRLQVTHWNQWQSDTCCGWRIWVTLWGGNRDREMCSFLRFHEHNYCSARTGTWNALIMHKKQTRRKRVYEILFHHCIEIPIFSLSFLLELLFPFLVLPVFCMSGICCVSHAYVHTYTHAHFLSTAVKGHFGQWWEMFSGGLVWARLI